MTIKLISMVCSCLNKVACICTGFLNASSENKITERDLAEWKRIEHVDQFLGTGIQKRR